MGQEIRFLQERVCNVSQTLELEDTGGKFRQVVESFREKQEACVIQDDEDRPVAVVLPIERYESYEAYRRRREENFAVLDRIAEKMQGYDPDYVESQIEKAVAEVKTEGKAKLQDS